MSNLVHNLIICLLITLHGVTYKLCNRLYEENNRQAFQIELLQVIVENQHDDMDVVVDHINSANGERSVLMDAVLQMLESGIERIPQLAPLLKEREGPLDLT